MSRHPTRENKSTDDEGHGYPVLAAVAMRIRNAISRAALVLFWRFGREKKSRKLTPPPPPGRAFFVPRGYLGGAVSRQQGSRMSGSDVLFDQLRYGIGSHFERKRTVGFCPTSIVFVLFPSLACSFV